MSRKKKEKIYARRPKAPGNLNAAESLAWKEFKSRRNGSGEPPGAEQIKKWFEEFQASQSATYLPKDSARKSSKRRILPTLGSGILKVGESSEADHNSLNLEFLKAYVPQLESMTNDEIKQIVDKTLALRSGGTRDQKAKIDQFLLEVRDIVLHRGAELILALGHNDYFKWPTTSLMSGRPEFPPDYNWEKNGPLSLFGYGVGNANALTDLRRRRVLTDVFQAHFLYDIPEKVRAEWGGAESSVRLQKMANSIAMFVKNAKRKEVPGYARAIDEWTSDLDYLYQEFYLHRFFFAWPAKRPRGKNSEF